MAKINQFYCEIGEKTKISIDKKSGARVMSLPFEFPDGTDGIVIICKMTQLPWKPSDEILNLNVNFKDNVKN